MNPLYTQIMSQMKGQTNNTPQVSGAPQFQNPMQKANYILNAMRNPAAFVRQAFPDIPAEIQNDPNQILSYLQRTRNISNEQIQNLVNQNPYPWR